MCCGTISNGAMFTLRRGSISRIWAARRSTSSMFASPRRQGRGARETLVAWPCLNSAASLDAQQNLVIPGLPRRLRLLAMTDWLALGLARNVMAGLVPAIHAVTFWFGRGWRRRGLRPAMSGGLAWMAGTSPAMTGRRPLVIPGLPRRLRLLAMRDWLALGLARNVMAGLVPAIHAGTFWFGRGWRRRGLRPAMSGGLAWMAGTSPAMTGRVGAARVASTQINVD